MPDLCRAFLFNGDKVIEPDDDVFLDSLEATVFGIPIKDNSQIKKYILLQNEEAQTPVYCIDSGKPGPTVYVVAGIHGDERAGWYAALMLAGCRIDEGRLYVLPQANILGCEQGERSVTGNGDLNRSYPGNSEGDLVQRLADAIYTDIMKVNPDLILDLHEAAYYSPKRDFMGNKLIITDLGGMEELFFNLLEDTHNGSLGKLPFDFTGPGIAGSINRVVTERLGIPVITVETFSGYTLSQRIQDQVDMVLYCLKHLNIL